MSVRNTVPIATSTTSACCVALLSLLGLLLLLVGWHRYMIFSAAILPMVSFKTHAENTLLQKLLPVMLMKFSGGTLFTMWWLSFAISSTMLVNKRVLLQLLIPSRWNSKKCVAWGMAIHIFGQLLVWGLLSLTMKGKVVATDRGLIAQFVASPLDAVEPELDVSGWVCLVSVCLVTNVYMLALIEDMKMTRSPEAMNFWGIHAFLMNFLVASMMLNLAISPQRGVFFTLITVAMMEMRALSMGVFSLDWRLLVGMVLLLCSAPTFVVIPCSVLWEFLDRGGMGRQKSGMVFRLACWWECKTRRLFGKLTKHPADGFMASALLLGGIIIPGWFVKIAFYFRDSYVTEGFPFWTWLAYHVFRLGPYVQTFGWVYTLCHKEGHAHAGLWKEPHNAVLRSSFNWWVGLFYGVLPSNFAVGHVRNHHKYNNGEKDIISTCDRPRDNILNFLAYLPRFWMYVTNTSTTLQFLKEKNRSMVWRIVQGTVVYVGWCAFWWKVSGFAFVVAFLLYPLAEQSLILGAISWCWHMFADQVDPMNPYMDITILGGPQNILEEDYHCVHHQYPGAHWTQHSELYQRSEAEYRTNRAMVFKDTHVFELWGMAVFRDYDALTDRFVDLSGEMSREEIREMIVGRLRTCCWGPLANVS